MKAPTITYGAIANGTLYTITKHDDYYSLWFIDALPTDMSIDGVENFMEENCNDGCSISGTYEQVMYELATLIADLQ